jgi:cobalt/nickel transport system permease protein
LSTIYLIDDYANNLDSAMHRASVGTKIASTVVALGTVIFSTTILSLVGQFLIILLFQFASRLPVKRLLIWAGYPAFFAAIFAISQAQYSVELSAQTMLRAVDAALLMLLLIGTTPFTRIIAVLGKASRTLSNLAFFSYRFLFLFTDESSRRLTALRVRGGFEGAIRTKIKNAANLIGLLFVSYFESGEKVYDAVKTRGYRGQFSTEAALLGELTRYDFAPVLFACLIVALFLAGSLHV